MAQKKSAKKEQKKVLPLQRRVKPELPGGFRDYGPREAIARAQMIETIRKTFESFGFDPLETSSVQRTDVLTGGEEDSGKIIFNVKGSQEETSDSSLRFDLTVPLARFIAANPDIPKPFKRYQIGTVWRGERPQAGRYREFLQADVDIVGSSSINADAEIIAVAYTTLKNLKVGDFKIQYNNRKLLNELPGYADFPEAQLWNALRIIDKAEKIGREQVERELAEMFNPLISAKIGKFIFESSGGTEEGYKEFREIQNALGILGVNSDEALSPVRWMVRGLSYYTGSVFETILTDAPEVGSVAGGGRYDDLVARFIGQPIPAVGISIGVDRLFAAMEKLGISQKQQTLTQALVLNLSSGLVLDYMEITKQLRDADINTSFYLGDDTSFQAQLSYAVKKEIPYVVIYGEEEKKKGVVAVKNLATRKQEEVKREQLVDFFKK